MKPMSSFCEKRRVGLPDSGQRRAWGSSAVTSGEGAVGPARSKGQMGSTPRERGGKICPPCNAQPGKGLCGEVGGLLPSHILGGSHEGQRDFVRHGDKVAKRYRILSLLLLLEYRGKQRKHAGSFLPRKQISFQEQAPGEHITPRPGFPAHVPGPVPR